MEVKSPAVLLLIANYLYCLLEEYWFEWSIVYKEQGKTKLHEWEWKTRYVIIIFIHKCMFGIKGREKSAFWSILLWLGEQPNVEWPFH